MVALCYCTICARCHLWPICIQKKKHKRPSIETKSAVCNDKPTHASLNLRTNRNFITRKKLSSITQCIRLHWLRRPGKHYARIMPKTAKCNTDPIQSIDCSFAHDLWPNISSLVYHLVLDGLTMGRGVRDAIELKLMRCADRASQFVYHSMVNRIVLINLSEERKNPH